MTGSIQITPVAYAEMVLDVYLDTFMATRSGYVVDSQRHVGEALTSSVAFQLISDKHSISGYLASEGKTHVGAIDLDEGSLDDGKRVRKLLLEQGIPSLLVESRRGCHLWTFYEGSGTHETEKWGPVPASRVRAALEAAVGLVGLAGPKAEIFPKRGSNPWACGALRLPLMRHPKTGISYPAYDMDDTVLYKLVDVSNAAAHMTAPYEKVWALAGGDTAPVAYPTDLGSYRQVSPSREAKPKVTDLFSSLGIPATVGHTIKCPFHEDGHASLSIAQDDERVFCKSPSCDLYNEGRGMGSLGLRIYLRKVKGRNPSA